MKNLLISFLLFTHFLFSQNFKGFDNWYNWNNPKAPTPTVEWKFNRGMTISDTGTTVIKSLVSQWKSIDLNYTLSQNTNTLRPIYDANIQGVLFDKIDDVLSLPAINCVSLNPDSGDFTFAGWLYFRNKNNQYIFGKVQNYDNQIMILTGGAGDLYLKLRDIPFSSIDNNIKINTSNIPTNEWFFFAFVVARSDTFYGYINGKNINATIASGSWANIKALNLINDGDYMIGRVYLAGYFGEYISDFMYFDRALSEIEIRRLYRKGRPK